MTAAPFPLSSELIVREGPQHGPAVLFILPLFEEANRMRRTVRLAMRALAERGIGSLLPDLPGQNESLVPTVEASVSLWGEALRYIAEKEQRPIVSAAIRGGALIDYSMLATATWRLAPVKGSALLKLMVTARIAADKEAGTAMTRDALMAEAVAHPIQLTGNWVSPRMVQELGEAVPESRVPLREVQLGSTDEPNEIVGTPLWLRAEPGEDAAMAKAIAKDIADWMRICGVI